MRMPLPIRLSEAFQNGKICCILAEHDVRMEVRDTKHPMEREGLMTSNVGKKLALVTCAAATALALTACGAQANSTSAAASEASSATSAAAPSTASATSTNTTTEASTFGTVANTLAQDESALVSEIAPKFTQETYTDPDTGLSVTYNLFLPEGYDESQSYPMVVFIADSSCAGSDAERSLTQGLGALVWASDEWQASNPCIVCVPTYPKTILDDHGSYTTTEYVELTARLIGSVSDTYAVDTNRIYGTGQSMGCMTTLILASEYPDLYAACMFVDGQWDVSTLQGLENQTFVYFAAEDDNSAFSGMTEVMEMFNADTVSYASAQWDGTWSCDELSSAAESLFSANENANFVSWTTGTIGTSSSGSSDSSGHGGGMGGASAHMASFDYAYNCVAVMEWLFQQ